MNNFKSPAILAMNVIRLIGDNVSKTGNPIRQLGDIADAIEAPSWAIASQIIAELGEEGLIRIGNISDMRHGLIFFDVNLSLDGWERYEAQQRGSISGNQGFIAMKFGDLVLDSFVSEVVKPAVKKIGYDLVDMRDVARAGVIDNLMRAQIRDSAFVIADLTHDNLGAYREAGYAEGLGKPVIYICEKSKFSEESTHFDTNHCTTVPWSKDELEHFSEELIATLRRSLEQQ